LPENSNLEITVYCTDNSELFYDGRIWKLDELVSSDLRLEERVKALEPLRKKTVKLSRDILITELTGRYLLFKIDSTTTGKQSPDLYEMKIYFTPNMWVDELPELYREQENKFLERYLAIFQTIYEELEDEIEGNLKNYSSDTAIFEMALLLVLHDRGGFVDGGTAKISFKKQLPYISGARNQKGNGGNLYALSGGNTGNYRI
jgi:hypothetical protein